MYNTNNILETIRMIEQENLDIRTVTMGISLLDCIDSDIDKACDKVYNKIVDSAKNLVPVCEQIEKTYADFVSSLYSNLNTELWDSLTFAPSDEPSVSGFFDVYNNMVN